MFKEKISFTDISTSNWSLGDTLYKEKTYSNMTDLYSD